MTQEEKQLLLKDLCARLPYRVICHTNEINIDGELIFVNKLYNIAALYYDNAIGKFESCPINDIKPYLRPMSSMSEEEKKEYRNTMYKETHRLYPNSADFTEQTDYQYTYKTFDYLNSIHVDYRGLIPKGLALEAPEGMYKID